MSLGYHLGWGETMRTLILLLVVAWSGQCYAQINPLDRIANSLEQAERDRKLDRAMQESSSTLQMNLMQVRQYAMGLERKILADSHAMTAKDQEIAFLKKQNKELQDAISFRQPKKVEAWLNRMAKEAGAKYRATVELNDPAKVVQIPLPAFPEP